MPKLRRLSGLDAVKIFQSFGFEVERIRGSHYVLRRITADGVQTITVPVHGTKQIGPGLLKRLYRYASRYIDEAALRPYFYNE
jgi:predicted RNA binding protein YcfA (HicA-like mRNA interferase family)